MIRFDNLSLWYDNHLAIDRLRLHWPGGACIGIHGPNGSGKTSLLQVAAGILRRYEGHYLWEGRPASQNLRELKSATFYAPENAEAPGYCTGREYLSLTRAVYGNRGLSVDEALTVTGLEAVSDNLCHGYSHGMRQKLAVAAALCSGARALFFDETFHGIDPASREKILHHLRHLFLNEQRLVVLASHQREWLNKHCTRVDLFPYRPE